MEHLLRNAPKSCEIMVWVHFFMKLSKRFEIEILRKKIHNILIYRDLYNYPKNMFYNMFFAMKIWILRSNFAPQKCEN